MIRRILSEKTYSSFALIVIFHIVGLVGFTNDPLVNLFKILVPFHLLLMLGIVLWNNTSWNKHFILFSILIFLFSFIVEMLGTNTGLIFGEYSYGKTLGFKLWNTPLMIAVNWFILVLGVGSILSYLHLKSTLVFSAIGATILTMLDFLIEPIAIKFDYWQWDLIEVPIQNYLAWWVLAFIFILIFRKLHFNKQNIVAAFLLGIQFVFFILLNLL